MMTEQMSDDDKALVVTLKHGGHSVFTKSVDLIERQAARIAELEAHIVTYRAKLDATLKDRAQIIAMLSDPNAVHLNMLRGTISKPTLAQIAHIYGDEWTAAIKAAEARGREEGLREAVDAARMAADLMRDEFCNDMGAGADEAADAIEVLIPAPPQEPQE